MASLTVVTLLQGSDTHMPRRSAGFYSVNPTQLSPILVSLGSYSQKVL